MNRNFPSAGVMSAGLRRLLTVFVTIALAGAMTFGTSYVARADSLDDQKKALESQIAAAKSNLDELNTKALAAQETLLASIDALQTANTKVDAANAAKNKAEAASTLAAQELIAARAAAEAAQLQASLAEQDVKAWVKVISAQVQQAAQQNTTMIALGALLNSTSINQASQQLQWTTTMLDSTTAKYDRLTELQYAAESASTAASQAQTTVATKAQQAADALTAAQTAADDAQHAADTQAAAVNANKAAKAALDAQVADAQNQQSQLEAEAASVQKKIEAQVAAAKAAAAKKAAAEAAARAAKGSTSGSSGSSSHSSSSNSSSSSSLLSRPVNGPVTSPYGMRLHPILKVWKLHDGIDFGAGCGTPMYAAASGTVTQKYYNVAYGNRLMINNGIINGHYITTGYNHAEYYVVSVGQHVNRGQLIGYVGTTGWSTGCHLHFMVWDDGSVVNPANWLA